MARVQLSGVTKAYGQVTAVDDLSLTVEDRDFLVLLGPSGCGKSTLLRLIAGLEEATAGSITIGDRVVDDLEPKHRDVAMVFQSYALYPHRSVRENIDFPLRTRHVPKAERDRAVDEAAAMLGLGDLLARKPGQLSGGQRQRVALARALVRRPAVFLMDEPLSNLDAKLRTQTRAELVDLHHRLAATIVYVTHDQVEAMTMGTRVAVLSKGVLEQVGPPQEVYDRPASVFVAQFMGSPGMTVLPGLVDGGVAHVSGGSLPLPPGVTPPGREVLVGVRPEHLEVDPEGTLKARLRLVEALGHERHLLCTLEDGTALAIRATASGDAPPEGTTLAVRAAPERVHVFDPATQRRVGP